jgi:sarcosine oxidase delta subunit
MPIKLTTEEFIAKFPESNRNTNCLENVACPFCGNRDRFVIGITATFDVFDNGTGYQIGDNEWDDKSYIRCGDCDERGTVGDFTIKGLDDVLDKRQSLKPV